MTRQVSYSMLMRLIIFFSTIILSDVSYAFNPHEKSRNSLVYLKAQGDVYSEDGRIDKVTEIGTGFIVSQDGLVLTTSHLLTDLGDVKPQSVKIDARIAQKNANPWNAVIVDAAVNTELLLLKIPPSREPYSKLRLGNAQKHNDDDSIYTSGFPESITYKKTKGVIEAREGPGGHLWMTSISYTRGLNGSPIYNSKSTVIGVLRGDKSSTQTFMIPIGFADSLLAQVRLREIQRALEDFNSLRSSFSWQGEYEANKDNPNITITYEKLMPGEPHVEYINILAWPMLMENGNRTTLNKAIKILNIPRAGSIGDKGGAFQLDALVSKVNDLKKVYDNIFQIKISIRPKLTNGVVQPSKKIIIPLEEE